MNEKDEKNEKRANVEPLTDIELVRLLEGNLDQSEHDELLARLGDDQQGCRVLALAQAGEPGDGLSSKTIDHLMGLVKASSKELSICQFCAGDLVGGCEFCPHCGARVKGNVLACIKCGKPVMEDGNWCPHCGSPFRKVERKGGIEIGALTLSLGLVSIILAFAIRSFILPLFGIGVLLVGIWVGDVLNRRKEKDRMTPKELAEKDSRRKTG
jgi:hypothetical protein